MVAEKTVKNFRGLLFCCTLYTGGTLNPTNSLTHFIAKHVQLQLQIMYTIFRQNYGMQTKW